MSTGPVLACPRCASSDQVQVVERRSMIGRTDPGPVLVVDGHAVPAGEFTFSGSAVLSRTLQCAGCGHGWAAPNPPVTDPYAGRSRASSVRA